MKNDNGNKLFMRDNTLFIINTIIFYISLFLPMLTSTPANGFGGLLYLLIFLFLIIPGIPSIIGIILSGINRYKKSKILLIFELIISIISLIFITYTYNYFGFLNNSEILPWIGLILNVILIITILNSNIKIYKVKNNI